MCTHLAKRGSVYYFRRKTPIQLISIYGKEIMKSLGTKDRRQAEVLVRQLGSQYDELFTKALGQITESHIQLSPAPAHQPKEIQSAAWDVGLTVDDAELYAAMFHKKLRASRERALADDTLSLFDSALNNLIGGNKEYLKTGIHPFEDNPKELWKLEAQIIAARALKKNKHLSYTNNTSQLKSKADERNYKNEVYLDSVIDKWSLIRHPAERTVAMTKSIVSKFNACIAPKPINNITKQDIVAFKDNLIAEGYSNANAKKYLTMIKALLNFAIGEAMLDLNPATGVSIKDKKLAKEKRLAFDLDSLNKIFSSPIYTHGARPSGGKGEASYWIPLIALFTGARLNEICQLTTQDLIKVEYVTADNFAEEAWVINITNEGEGQTIKNEGSKRRVPIHNELVKLGIINYVNSIPKGGRLFPELTAAKTYGSISANWSKWFNRYLREVIHVTNPRMVFHSFRHSFKDHARNSGISTEVHHAITGHSSGNVGDNYGGEVYPMRPLVEAMDKYQVQGLNLHINMLK